MKNIRITSPENWWGFLMIGSQKLLVFIHLLLFIPAAIIFLPFAAHSEPEPLDLGNVLVEAESKAEEEEKVELTAFVTIIENEDFAARATSISEVLSDSVGINIRSSGGPGSYSSVSIRGASSNQVAIYLDGVPLFNARAGEVNLEDLPLDDVERIEIYRGTSPARLGEPSIGGAINIITKKAALEPVNEVTASYGTANSTRFDLTRSSTHGNFNYLVYGNWFSSDGDFRYHDDNGTPYNPNDDEYRDRQNNDSESLNLFMKMGYEPSWGGKFDLSEDFFSKDQGIPGTGSAPALNTRIKNNRNIKSFADKEF